MAFPSNAMAAVVMRSIAPLVKNQFRVFIAFS
jgi:hypothetical protein